MTKMASGGPITDRAQNFYLDYEAMERSALEEPELFIALENLKDKFLEFATSDKAKDMSSSDLLFKVYSRIYHLIERLTFSQESVFNRHPLCDEMYEPGLYTALCGFLHDSKRIERITIEEFMRRHYPSYPDTKELQKNDYLRHSLKCLNDNLRQYHSRLYSMQNITTKAAPWHAMAEDSEYEWAFWFALYATEETLPEEVKDTFNRIKRLYNDIYPALDSERDDEYKNRVNGAYKRFQSKLRKIKFENYLKLQSAILSHICKDEENYGSNIYRLEKRMKPYITMSEVDRLSRCQSGYEEKIILTRFAILKDIFFPTVYESFAQLPYDYMVNCARNFSGFLQTITLSSCLVLDELVEKGIFGDNWEAFFKKSINDMAVSVFYRPYNLEFTDIPKSQRNFVNLLSEPVKIIVHNETGAFPNS